MGEGRSKAARAIATFGSLAAMLTIGGCASDQQAGGVEWAGIASALGFTHTIECDPAALTGLSGTHAAHRADPETLRQARAEVEGNCTAREPS